MMTALTDISDPELLDSHCYQVKTFSKLRSKFPYWFFLDPFNTKIAHLCNFSTERVHYALENMYILYCQKVHLILMANANFG